jgi:hypothetical protein
MAAVNVYHFFLHLAVSSTTAKAKFAFWIFGLFIFWLVLFF